MRLSVLSFLVVLFVGATSAQEVEAPANAPSPTAIETISLAALLADPSSYDGRRVQTQGVLAIEFEGDALYLTREHREHFVSSNALWVNIRDEGWDLSRLAVLDGSYVTIEAKVDANDKGHFGLFRAALVNIGAIQVLE